MSAPDSIKYDIKSCLLRVGFHVKHIIAPFNFFYNFLYSFVLITLLLLLLLVLTLPFQDQPMRWRETRITSIHVDKE